MESQSHRANAARGFDSMKSANGPGLGASLTVLRTGDRGLVGCGIADNFARKRLKLTSSVDNAMTAA
jgi:hypothetical protein